MVRERQVRAWLWIPVLLALAAPAQAAPEDAPVIAAEMEAGTPEDRGPETATDRIVARFMDLDGDETGGVSLDEYLAMVTERATTRFESMDGDGDGEVSDEEYRSFWKARRAQWYRLKR